MIISLDTKEKKTASDKIQWPFMVKTSTNLEIKGNILGLTKQQQKSYIVLNTKRLNVFSLKWERKQRCPFSSFLFSTVLEVQASARKHRRVIKHINQKEVKLSLFADDMTVHTENPKEPTRKLLVLTVYSLYKIIQGKVIKTDCTSILTMNT